MSNEYKSGRVFILGAGFSNYLSDGHFPVMKTLNTEIQSEFPWLKKYKSNGLDFDIEQTLTYLELDIVQEKNKRTKKALEKKKDAIIKFLTQRLDTKSIPEERLKGKATQCMTFLQPGDYLLTFNWDCLLEKILWEAGIWSPYDGYGYSLNMNQNSSGYPANKKVNPLFITILKLHGSLNFTKPDYLSGHFNISQFPINFISSDERNTPEDSGSISSVTLPTYIKMFDGGEGYFRIWKEAMEAISSAEVLCIIGYSLPLADSMARFLIANGGSKAPLKRVAIVNWSLEDCLSVQEKIQGLAELKYKNIPSEEFGEDVEWYLIEASKEGAFAKLAETLLKWPLKDLSKSIAQRLGFHKSLQIVNILNRKNK